MSFIKSIKTQSKKYEFPFDHWEYNNALSDEAINEIIKTDVPDVSKYNLNYDGLEQSMVVQLNLEKELLQVVRQ